MDGWNEITRVPVIRPQTDPNAIPPNATTCVFDEQSDLVWTGESTGFIGSFSEAMLAPYTRFRAHYNPVKQLLPHFKGVLSTDGQSLRLTSRKGLTEFYLDETFNAEFKHIRRIEYISHNELLISVKGSLLRFDISKTTVTKTIPYSQEVILTASNKRYIALGRVDGAVDIFDQNQNSIIKTFTSSTGSLSDLDLKEHTLATCGYSRRHGSFVLDPLVNVYDLRTLRSLAPIAFPAGAAFVRLHPRLSSFAVIASKTGQLQVIDMFNPANVSLYQIDVGPMMQSLELSSTGDFLACIDAYSLLHLWSHNPEHSKMSSRAPLELPSVPDLLPQKNNIDDDSIPLNSVGLPYYKEPLLSAWPAQTVFRSNGTIPKKIDQAIYQNAEVVGNVTVAPYDKEKYGRRNLAQRYVAVTGNTETGRFLSSRNTAAPTKDKKQLNTEDIFDYKNEREPNTPPNAYKKLEILYSKFGVDDFDFSSYNKTVYSGLESHVDNSYTNSLLQLYRFVPEIFSFLISNLSVENLLPNSFLRELGYLFDMLVKSSGKNYRPSNFQYALSNTPEAYDLGLIEKENDSSQKKRLNDTFRLQLFNRFLLDKITSDEKRSKQSKGTTVFADRIFGIEVETRTRPVYGSSVSHSVNTIHTLEVSSPLANNMKPIMKPQSEPSIVEYIQSSLNRVEQTTVLNEATGVFDVLECSHVVTSLPPVVSINLHLSDEEKRAIRNIKDWLRPNFQAAFSKSGFILADNTRVSQQSEFFNDYELTGFVAEISGLTDKDKHLVTFARIYDENTGCRNWYLFNDFLVIPVPDDEALNLSYWWKTPVSLIYRNSANPSNFAYDAWKINLDDSILYRDHFAAGTRESKKIEYELLTREEAPKPGTLIAIDAEFVTLEEEQFEIKSDGTRSLLKPSNQALARVSVLRGDDGEKFGVPFIDDYVVIKEKIHDYLTSYSGIEPGDLDVEISNKPLVTREVVYRKLWLLLNLGCIFVGHGLTKDFRTINISVPKSQVRDTSVFFYKGQRILSLRFLAYILLNERVQTGNHDSIEDAHTALLLYKEYLNLKSRGQFDEILEYIYKEGQVLKFKPPEDD